MLSVRISFPIFQMFLLCTLSVREELTRTLSMLIIKFNVAYVPPPPPKLK
jgi:hypothetical protein